MTTLEISMREHILATAKSLFIQQGYHGLAMRQIAEAIGVSKAALYYHFKDKEALFLAIITVYLDEMETALNRIQASPANCGEKIVAFVEYVLTQPAEQRAIIRLASQEMAQISIPARQTFNTSYHEKFLDKIKTILCAGMENGEFRQIQPDVATWALLGIMYPYFYPTHTGDTPLPTETIREITVIYLNGIAKS